MAAAVTWNFVALNDIDSAASLDIGPARFKWGNLAKAAAFELGHGDVPQVFLALYPLKDPATDDPLTRKPTAEECRAAVLGPRLDPADSPASWAFRSVDDCWFVLAINAPATPVEVAASSPEGAPVDITRQVALFTVSSPSSGFPPAKRLLLTAPLSLRVDASVEKSFSGVIGRQTDSWADLMRGSALYPLATAFLPPDVAARREDSSADGDAPGVFLKAQPGGLLDFRLYWSTEPGLLTRPSREGIAPFNGELKSTGDCRALDSVATHALLGMASSLFRTADRTQWRFYRRPPVGFGIVGFPYVAHLVAVEMIGQLFVSPVSKPFVIASPEHELAIDSLPTLSFGEPIELSTGDLAGLREKQGVCWTGAPVGGFFYKFLPGPFPSVRHTDFERLFRVYARLGELKKPSTSMPLPREGGAAPLSEGEAARPSEDELPPRPSAIVDAELLYGFLCVAVRMPFVDGRTPTPVEMMSAPVMSALADAIAWLLRRGLLYIDIRLPNVMISGEGARLVDYEDVVLLPDDATPKTREEATAVFDTHHESVARWPVGLRQAVIEQFPAPIKEGSGAAASGH